MTALLTPDRTSSITPIPFPNARVSAAHPSATPVSPLRPSRPELVVIEGGRSSRQRSLVRTYRLRRLGLVLALAVVGALVWGLVSLGTPPAGASHGAAPVITSARYVVRPGDSLWGIAKALHRGGDLRDTVDELAAANGSDTVVAGRAITIPADLRS